MVTAAHPGSRTALTAVHRLSAGASRLTLLLETTIDGEVVDLVAQVEQGSVGGLDTDEHTIGVGVQGELLRLLAATAVPVPRLVLADDGGILGAPLLLTARVHGETLPRRILRDPGLHRARDHFAADCGRILAALHTVDPASVELARPDVLDAVRARLEWAQEPRPVFETAYCWLVDHRPPTRSAVLVHGDFRLGNLAIGADGVTAVLDWELAHLGDPLEDLGWLCSTAWRFGSPRPVGGMGEREDLYVAYEAAGGHPVDRRAGFWWEVLASLSWGAICMHQARRHLHGGSRSVELAAIGRRVCETEWDLLGLLGIVAVPDAAAGDGTAHRPTTTPPAPTTTPPAPTTTPPTSTTSSTGGQHGRPTAAELVEAVREWLTGQLGPVVPDEQRFHLRVASNVLATVERELAIGPGQAAAHAARLAAVGYDDDAELASAIRAGQVEHRRQADVDATMVADVRDRLAVANPGYAGA